MTKNINIENTISILEAGISAVLEKGGEAQLLEAYEQSLRAQALGGDEQKKEAMAKALEIAMTNYNKLSKSIELTK